jgi:O-antigen ligase
MSGVTKINNYASLSVLGSALPLALALAITFNLLTGPVAAVAVALSLLVTLSRFGWPALLVSLSIFGGIYFSLFHQYLGVGITFFQILITGIMALIIIVHQPRKVPEGIHLKIFNYLVWVGLVWCLMLLNFLTTVRTEYSTYFISYFLMYASSSVVAGILVYCFSVKLEDLIIPSLLILSCLYPLLGVTPVQMRSALDPHWGLRAIEEFIPITHARLSGLLFVMLLIHFSSSSRKLQKLPELFLGSLICLPIVWFSYTRQSVVSVLLISLIMAARMLFAGELLRKYRQRVAVLLFSGILAVGIMFWFFSEGPRIESMQLTEQRTSTVDSDHFRLRAWQDSWNAIKRNPLIGYGIGWFAREHGGREFSWPHNWFIEAWLEHGLAGLLLFLLGAGFILKPLLRFDNRNSDSWALAGLYWLIVVQLSGDIARNSLIFFFITVCALHTLPLNISPISDKLLIVPSKLRDPPD